MPFTTSFMNFDLELWRITIGCQSPGNETKKLLASFKIVEDWLLQDMDPGEHLLTILFDCVEYRTCVDESNKLYEMK